MVRAIYSEADHEWRAWRSELARRHTHAQAEKEYAAWKQQTKSKTNASLKENETEKEKKVCKGLNRFAF